MKAAQGGGSDSLRALALLFHAKDELNGLGSSDLRA